jgi:hypothetical protein
VDLSIIDEAMVRAGKAVRQATEREGLVPESLDRDRRELEQYVDLDRLKNQLMGLEAALDSGENLLLRKEHVATRIARTEKAEKKIETYSKYITEGKFIIRKVESSKRWAEKLVGLKALVVEGQRIAQYEKMEEPLGDLRRGLHKSLSMEKELSPLRKIVENLESSEREALLWSKRLVEYQEQKATVKVCPLCGGKMDA